MLDILGIFLEGKFDSMDVDEREDLLLQMHIVLYVDSLSLFVRDEKEERIPVLKGSTFWTVIVMCNTTALLLIS